MDSSHSDEHGRMVSEIISISSTFTKIGHEPGYGSENDAFSFCLASILLKKWSDAAWKSYESGLLNGKMP
jgi:hypothetical protein